MWLSYQVVAIHELPLPIGIVKALTAYFQTLFGRKQ